MSSILPLRVAFDHLLVASWQASVMIALVAASHALLGRRISPRWRGAMWMLVFVRLAMPALPPSPMSVFNLRPSSSPPSPAVQPAEATTVTYGVVLPPPTPFVTAPAIPPPPNPPTDWFNIAAAIWSVTAIALIARHCFGMILAARRFCSLPHSIDPRLRAVMRECADEMNAAPLDIAETDLIATPALAGIIRPVLLIPPALAAGLSRDELRAVMHHELAHAQRNDV